MPYANCAAPTTTEMRRRTTLSLSDVPLPRLPADLQREASGFSTRPTGR